MLLIGACFTMLLFMYSAGGADPVVRRLTVSLPGWPTQTPAMRVILLSDLHVAGPETPPERLARVVTKVNALKPDLVLIAGDFVTEKRTAAQLYGADEAIAPLAKLRARFGTIAVMGNHDHWLDTNAVHAALARAHIRVLDNQAVWVGPLAIGGVDDDFTGRANLRRVAVALQAKGGVPILLSHSPDIFPDVPSSIGLTLAGHTHCGQIVLPFYGAVSTVSRYGARYRCGVIRQGNKRLVVSAGIGTSILPLRLNAPADLWLIDLVSSPSLAPTGVPH